MYFVKIEKNSTILEIVEKYPKSQDFFRSHDEKIGKCLMCNHLFESLEEICKIYNLNLDNFIKDLEKNIDF